jgi:hypothetical protein
MAEVTLKVRDGYFNFPEMKWEEVPVEEVNPENEEVETTTEQEGEN